MKLLIAISALVAGPLLAAPPNDFFAMDTIARGKPEQVVPLLKELGYQGLGGQAGDTVMAEALEAAGLRFYNGYLTLSLDDRKPAVDDHLRRLLHPMPGHASFLWLAVKAVSKGGLVLPKSSLEGDEIAVTQLREIADYAWSKGVRTALYPHTGTWIEHVDDAVRVANKINLDHVGVTFNLCHWLRVEGNGRDPLPVLKAAGPRLMFVTINGADAGDTKSMGWDRLIQPLGSGTYDVAAFMKKVHEAGYMGPVGFQGFGIKADPREVLKQTIAAWKALQPSL